MKVTVAQLGARMHYAVPRILHNQKLLERLFTDISSEQSWPQILKIVPDSLLPQALRRLKGRKILEVPKDRIKSFPTLGIRYAYERSRTISTERLAEISIRYGKEFNAAIANKSRFQCGDIIYGFNSASLELFRHAKKQGARLVLEQTIAPRAVEISILEEYAREYKNWKPLDMAGGKFVEEFCEREQAEWQLADAIFCGSEFVKQSIGNIGGPKDRCIVIPYGVHSPDALPLKNYANKAPLKILTAGAIGLRKGSPILERVAAQLRGICEFRAAGPLSAPPAAISSLSKHVDLLGTVPRSEMAKLYRWADIFFLPSLCEGSATVTYEAMMHGLPVICTPNTGSAVIDGVSGHIVDPKKPEDFARILRQLFNDRIQLESLAAGARSQSSQLSEMAYSERLVRALNRIDGDAKPQTIS